MALTTHYYLSIFPMEALIASQLEPDQFGTYMATGSKKGSAEQIIFIEIEGNFGKDFDWEYAKENCIPHETGDPKHSLYLSIYRVLEHVPLEKMGSCFLTTRDGRTLKLDNQSYDGIGKQDFSVYMELCPVHPVIVSSMGPKEFSEYLTSNTHKTAVPKIIFTDLKTPDLNNPEKTGNMGNMYSQKYAHLMSCVSAVTSGKPNKTLDRSHVETFTFNVIKDGIFVGDGKDMLFYKMPTVDEIKQIDYDWGRSALIL